VLLGELVHPFVLAGVGAVGVLGLGGDLPGAFEAFEGFVDCPEVFAELLGYVVAGPGLPV